MDLKSRMESFFDTTFDDEDFITTEEESMALEDEELRLQDLRMELLALKVRSDLSEEEYDHAARKLVTEFLKDA